MRIFYTSIKTVKKPSTHIDLFKIDYTDLLYTLHYCYPEVMVLLSRSSTFVITQLALYYIPAPQGPEGFVKPVDPQNILGGQGVQSEYLSSPVLLL